MLDSLGRARAVIFDAVKEAPEHMPDDRALVAAMATGDERAAATLYDRHGGVLFALALRIVGERADAEEVVLEAFMQAWRGAGRYEVTRGPVRGWLAMIARTRALDVVRRRGRETEALRVAAIMQPGEPLGMYVPLASPDHDVSARERASAVACALDELAAPQRLAIELAFFEGLSHSEIATRLAEPLGTVKTRIRLGLTRLRTALRKLAPETVA
jgi:RNA polymerase sigma-70 factor, ECF subfamily